MLDVFRSVVEEVNSVFVYKTDKDLYGVDEHWGELEEIDGKLYGDCESHSITIANRCIERGIPNSDLYVHLVGINRDPDHIVLEYDGWYADCNSRGITKRIPYKKFSKRRLSEKEWTHS